MDVSRVKRSTRPQETPLANHDPHRERLAELAASHLRVLRADQKLIEIGQVIAHGSLGIFSRAC